MENKKRPHSPQRIEHKGSVVMRTVHGSGARFAVAGAACFYGGGVEGVDHCVVCWILFLSLAMVYLRESEMRESVSVPISSTRHMGIFNQLKNTPFHPRLHEGKKNGEEGNNNNSNNDKRTVATESQMEVALLGRVVPGPDPKVAGAIVEAEPHDTRVLCDLCVAERSERGEVPGHDGFELRGGHSEAEMCIQLAFYIRPRTTSAAPAAAGVSSVFAVRFGFAFPALLPGKDTETQSAVANWLHDAIHSASLPFFEVARLKLTRLARAWGLSFFARGQVLSRVELKWFLLTLEG